MNKNIVIASVAVLFTATPALAQDDATFKGGARVEARLGLDDVVLSINGASGSKAGVTYGGEVGYDLKTSGVVLGVYAGVEGSSAKKCGAVYGNDEACLGVGRNITGGVRVGGVVGHGLLYVKGGYSNGRITAAYRDFSNLANNVSAGANGGGFHVGGGYETNLSAHTYLKAEYVFTHYSTDHSSGFPIGFERHQGVVGFGYRF